MTHYELNRASAVHHPSADAVRALVLVLATVVVAMLVSVLVPNAVWTELSVPRSYGIEDWHGNVMRAGPAF